MSIQYKQIRGTIRCESGVRVGGSRDELEIGGVDNPIVRDPGSGEPYLPGSSIKGRMRSLLERDLDKPLGGRRGEEPHGCEHCLFCKVFGPHKMQRHSLGPSRLIVRDAYLSADSLAALRGGKEITEVRTENMIDRQSNTATHPRPVERVARGITFDLALTVRLFQGDPDTEIEAMVRRALYLLLNDGIGGGISRGHGQISITITEPQGWTLEG